MKKKTYVIDDFLQTVKIEKPTGVIEHKFFDFEKIAKAGFLINVIISERWSKGKTYNSKAFMVNEWINHKRKSLWVRNLLGDLEREMTDFLADVPETFNEARFEGSPAKNTLRLKFPEDDDSFCRFLSMNGAESLKGSRTWYRYVFWDEFNVNADNVRRMVDKFASLQETLNDAYYGVSEERTQSWFIFGNYKTLSHPILVQMGIDKIEDEITCIYDPEGNPLIMVIVPKPSMDDIQKLWSNRTVKLSLAERMGYADHAYLNQNLYDNLHRVFPLKEHPIVQSVYSTPVCVIYVDGYYLHIQRTYIPPTTFIKYIEDEIPEKGRKRHIESIRLLKEEKIKEFHCFITDKQDWRLDFNSLLYANVSDKLEGWIQLNHYTRQSLLDLIGKDRMSFETVFARELLFKATK